MKCDAVQNAYLTGEASPEQLAHMEACSVCRSARSGFDATLRLLDDVALWQEPTNGAEDDLVALISGRSEPGTDRRRGRWWMVAAAAVVFVVATGGLWTTIRTPDPDWSVSVLGTAAAPTASAVVQGWNEPGGTRLGLVVDGLAPAPPGSVYEVWLSRDSVHISAGTFASAGEVELWVGVARREFPRIWITLEPLDEDEAPSATTVLDTAER